MCLARLNTLNNNHKVWINATGLSACESLGAGTVNGQAGDQSMFYAHVYAERLDFKGSKFMSVNSAIFYCSLI